MSQRADPRHPPSAAAAPPSQGETSGLSAGSPASALLRQLGNQQAAELLAALRQQQELSAGSATTADGATNMLVRVASSASGSVLPLLGGSGGPATTAASSPLRLPPPVMSHNSVAAAAAAPGGNLAVALVLQQILASQEAAKTSQTDQSQALFAAAAAALNSAAKGQDQKALLTELLLKAALARHTSTAQQPRIPESQQQQQAGPELERNKLLESLLRNQQIPQSDDLGGVSQGASISSSGAGQDTAPAVGFKASEAPVKPEVKGKGSSQLRTSPVSKSSALPAKSSSVPEDDVTLPTASDEEDAGASKKKTDFSDLASERFPYKLYRMLTESERKGWDHILSFVGDEGTMFAIHKPQKFAAEVLPLYFASARMASFQRQLNLYSFRRVTEGPHKGAFYHVEGKFAKGKRSWCQKVRRKKTPSQKPSQATGGVVAYVDPALGLLGAGAATLLAPSAASAAATGHMLGLQQQQQAALQKGNDLPLLEHILAQAANLQQQAAISNQQPSVIGVPSPAEPQPRFLLPNTLEPSRLSSQIQQLLATQQLQQQLNSATAAAGLLHASAKRLQGSSSPGVAASAPASVATASPPSQQLLQQLLLLQQLEQFMKQQQHGPSPG